MIDDINVKKSSDVEQKPIENVIIVEKVEQKQAEIPIKTDEKPVIKTFFIEKNSEKPVVSEKEKTSIIDDINYKEILSGLFANIPEKKVYEPQKTKQPINHASFVEENNQKVVNEKEVKEDKVKQQNDLIDIKNINKQSFIKPRNFGKIDFSDLIEQADNEGFKIRISSKKQRETKRHIWHERTGSYPCGC